MYNKSQNEAANVEQCNVEGVPVENNSETLARQKALVILVESVKRPKDSFNAATVVTRAYIGHGTAACDKHSEYLENLQRRGK